MPKSEPTTTAAANMTLLELQCAYSVLEYKHKNLQQNRQKRNGKNQQDSGAKMQKWGETAGNKSKSNYYCYAHGTQGSHTSAQCKVMAS